jgi:hypothetical protein
MLACPERGDGLFLRVVGLVLVLEDKGCAVRAGQLPGGGTDNLHDRIVGACERKLLHDADQVFQVPFGLHSKDSLSPLHCVPSSIPQSEAGTAFFASGSLPSVLAWIILEENYRRLRCTAARRKTRS